MAKFSSPSVPVATHPPPAATQSPPVVATQPSLPPVLATQPSQPKQFSLDDETKLRIERMLTPGTTKRVTIAWNFVRKEGRILDAEIEDAHKRYLSDLPLPAIKKEIRAALEASRKVTLFYMATMQFYIVSHCLRSCCCFRH